MTVAHHSIIERYTILSKTFWENWKI